MKRTIFLLVSIFFCCFSYGQVRTITGKVIDEFELTPVSGVKIQNRDSVLLATTDLKGTFEVKITQDIDELRLSFIGMEGTLVKIPTSCNNVEIIMMTDVIYDYITARKINRKRRKRFEDLPNKHNEAFRKGVFSSNAPCFEYIFENY